MVLVGNKSGAGSRIAEHQRIVVWGEDEIRLFHGFSSNMAERCRVTPNEKYFVEKGGRFFRPRAHYSRELYPCPSVLFAMENRPAK